MGQAKHNQISNTKIRISTLPLRNRKTNQSIQYNKTTGHNNLRQKTKSANDCRNKTSRNKNKPKNIQPSIKLLSRIKKQIFSADKWN